MMVAAKNAHLSEVDPDFAPLIPGINAAFEQIWEVKDATVLRAKFASARRVYPDYVPTQGFAISHESVPVSDGGSVEIRIYRPTHAKGILPLMYVCHGGGWTTGTHDSEGSMNYSVCVNASICVISVDYRRAPEHPFPTPLNDAYEVLKWVISNSSCLEIDPSQIILAGSSSGANILAVVAIRARDEGIKGIVGQALNIPVTCHPKFYPSNRYELLSFKQNAHSPTTNADHMNWFWNQYFPDADADPEASPLLAKSHADLPPALIQVGGSDPLRDEGIAYANALEAAGVATTLKTYQGLPHGFIMVTALEATQEYYQTITDWVIQRLASFS